MPYSPRDVIGTIGVPFHAFPPSPLIPSPDATNALLRNLPSHPFFPRRFGGILYTICNRMTASSTLICFVTRNSLIASYLAHSNTLRVPACLYPSPSSSSLVLYVSAGVLFSDITSPVPPAFVSQSLQSASEWSNHTLCENELNSTAVCNISYILHFPNPISAPSSSSAVPVNSMPAVISTSVDTSSSAMAAVQSSPHPGVGFRRSPTHRPTFNPVATLSSLPALRIGAVPFMERLQSTDQASVNSTRLAASARHLRSPSTPSSRTRGAHPNRRTTAIAHTGRQESMPPHGFQPLQTQPSPALPPPQVITGAASSRSSTGHSSATIVVLPCPLAGIPTVFPFTDHNGFRPYGGLKKSELTDLVNRFRDLNLLYDLHPHLSPTALFEELDLQLRTYLATHHIYFPVHREPHPGDNPTPSVPTSHLLASSLFDFVIPGRASRGIPGSYGLIQSPISTENPILSQLRDRYRNWSNPVQTYRRDVLAFIVPRFGGLAGHLPPNFDRSPGLHQCFVRVALHRLSHCDPAFDHLDESCLGPECIVPPVHFPNHSPSPSEVAPQHSNALIPRRRPLSMPFQSPSHHPNSPTTVRSTRPRLSSQTHTPESSVSSSLSLPFLATVPSPPPASPSTLPDSQPHVSPLSPSTNRPPSPSILYLEPLGSSSVPIHDNPSQRRNLPSSPPFMRSPSIEVIDLTSPQADRSRSSSPIAFGGFSVDPHTDDEDDGCLEWVPVDHSSAAYHARCAQWTLEARRLVPAVSPEFCRVISAPVYPGESQSNTQSAFQMVSLQLATSLFTLLKAAYPDFPARPPSSRAQSALQQFIARLCPGNFRVEVILPLNGSMSSGRVLTAGAGPTRQALRLLLQQYAALLPHSSARTPDGFMAIRPRGDPPSHEHEVFWRGVGILSAIWILHTGTPPFNISPLLVYVAGCQQRDTAADICRQPAFIRTFAPIAATMLSSWDRLASQHVTDPSHSQKLSRQDPQHSIRHFLPFLDEFDVFYERQAFADFKTFIWVVWQDPAADVNSYLQDRLKWLHSRPDDTDWRNIQLALRRYLSREGHPLCTSSPASEGLRAVYLSIGLDPEEFTIPSQSSARYIRRRLLNRVCLGDENMGDLVIKIALTPNLRSSPIHAAQYQDAETLVTARVCFSELTVSYGTVLAALSNDIDDGQQFDQTMHALLLSASDASHFNMY
ncbi:hypothetical protein CALCODRAFT_533804 [Calocera cornea HHB12733]|uniref:Uncharacterized protein n=1 Tax=Calocera cornea HHB12733 TaxID=1353952 RepID=A0A165K5F5_9BASI|nr:hypothetical protein CALCODRAFT_533804 [Calocera cornea HHB12733]